MESSLFSLPLRSGEGAAEPLPSGDRAIWWGGWVPFPAGWLNFFLAGPGSFAAAGIMPQESHLVQ